MNIKKMISEMLLKLENSNDLSMKSDSKTENKCCSGIRAFTVWKYSKVPALKLGHERVK
jgi:hypothetical protein